MNKPLSMIAIIAGGTPPDSFVKEIESADFVIGVDRGAYWLVTHHVSPDLAVGDFDSVTLVERKLIEKYAKRVVVHPAKKDATDLELAIDEAIKLNPKSVVIYGALGSRFDHSMAAIQMLLKLESHNILGQIVDNFNKISIVRRRMIITKNPSFLYISIISFGVSAVVTLEGFVYDVLKKKFMPDSSLGISNEIVGVSAIITVHRGLILVVQSSD